MMDLFECDIDVELDEEERVWNARFPPLMVYVDAPYAKYIEYGTGPSIYRDENGAYSRGKYISDAYLARLENWVRSKFGQTDKEDVRNVAYRIGMNIMRNGTKPHPFARPAMEDMIWDIDNGMYDFNDPTLTSWILAANLMERMRYYLDKIPGPDESPRKYPTNYSTSHILYNSMHIDPAPPGVTATLSINIIESMDDVVVRDSSTLGYHGYGPHERSDLPAYSL